MKLSELIPKLNNTILFDPSRWPRRELAGRICAVTVIILFLGYKACHFDSFPGFYSKVKLFYQTCPTAHFPEIRIQAIWLVRVITWMLETGILCGYIVSYLLRTNARSIARGFMETAFPFIIASVPVALSLTPYNFDQCIPHHSVAYFLFYMVIMGLMAAGTLINLAGLLVMRKAFAVMAEARTLITGGMFRFVRHPLYTGHMIITFAMVCMRWHWYTVLTYILFIIGVFIRARIEETKVEQTFPDYAEYKRKTGMFFPKFLTE